MSRSVGSPFARLRTVLLALVVASATVAAVPAAGQAEPELSVPDDVLAGIGASKTPAVYIVMLEDDPAVVFEGDIPGLGATRPGRGEKIDPTSAAVRRYQRYLTGKHDEALAAVGIGSDAKVYDYTISFNGFSAVMTGLDAISLSKQPGVVGVWENEMRQPTTDRSPEYLDMEEIWDRPAGATLGEDVIIGVVDTGIDPENPSFSDQEGAAVPDGHGPGNRARNAVYGPAPDHWSGSCQPGEQFSRNDCNNKLIGARWFADGHTNLDVKASGDYLSARDANGHGTHTASTAGGNQVETVLPNGDTVEISGMAPRARIAAYKACWQSGCALADLVAAIDTAVADGVDAINYSIGSDTPSLVGPDGISFLFAAEAGVFVATSNGNAGPGANTTGSPSSVPWLISVGAVDHGRNFLGEVALGDGATYSGVSLNDTEVSGTLVDAEDAGDALCNIGELDPSVVEGNIVLCERGVIARVDKSAAVAEAGGVGMIMFNPSGDSLNADTHVIPSIHVDHVVGPQIKAYVDAEGEEATATIQEGGVLGTVNEDVMAGFSSRGLGASEDLIKPDIIAPGVNVLAALPGGTGFVSGTSMASPHIAGIGALLIEEHPDWSAAAVKSALMTTASPEGILKEDQATPATPFDQGSGVVASLAALDPGLVYEAGLLEHIGFLCGNTQIVHPDDCEFLDSLGVPFDGSDLNQPNLAIGSLAGEQTVVRTVTNVGPAGSYSVAVEAPGGIDVTVEPETLELDEGESATFEVTFQTTEAATLGTFAFGSLAWSDGTHDVRSVLAVRPVQAAVPGEVFGEGTDGSGSFDISFGYSGDYTAAAHGLVPATREAGNVADDPANDINTALRTGEGITVHETTIPPGTAHARISLFDDFTDGDDDLDLYVFGPTGAFVGGSGTPTSEEEVTLGSPDPGDYVVVVHGWQTDGADSNYTLFNWNVLSDPDGDEGTLSVSGPAAATLGTTDSVDYSWSGLAPDDRYLGAVSHRDGGGIFDWTLVSIATD